MKTCGNCGKESYRVESKFCLGCGAGLSDIPENTPHINICTNSDCDFNKTKFIYPDDAKFCDVCGSKTAYNG
ncbi:MAG: hypothetical protein FWF82_06325 [Oscillospiraceae bacterium]|jgi:rRNA maturation endonuclease Nob1|nr:hypothetical protein [Oscillospiraceae bacterium]